jgi:Protein of unknown function (DUF4238)
MTHRFQKAATLEEHVKKVLEQACGSLLHHWVPQFLLRQFTDEPQAENPAIWCMPVDGDQPRLSCVHDECAIKGHNLLVESADLPKTAIEGLYGYVEGLAAPMVRTLLDGGDLDSEERSAHTTGAIRGCPVQRAWAMSSPSTAVQHTCVTRHKVSFQSLSLGGLRRNESMQQLRI